VLRISKRPEPANTVHCFSCIWHEPFCYSCRHRPTSKNTLRGNPGCAVGPKTPTPFPFTDRRSPLNLNALQAGRLQPLACRRRRLGDSAIGVCWCAAAAAQRCLHVSASGRLRLRVGSGGLAAWHLGFRGGSGLVERGQPAALAGHLGFRGGSGLVERGQPASQVADYSLCSKYWALFLGPRRAPLVHGHRADAVSMSTGV
jgi:hypothetical protein